MGTLRTFPYFTGIFMSSQISFGFVCLDTVGPTYMPGYCLTAPFSLCTVGFLSCSPRTVCFFHITRYCTFSSISPGTVCGQQLIEHPDVRKLGFTGSTPVGKTIMAACAKSNLKKCSLELGGKSPLIIFADCDLTKAVRMVSYPFVTNGI